MKEKRKNKIKESGTCWSVIDLEVVGVIIEQRRERESTHWSHNLVWWVHYNYDFFTIFMFKDKVNTLFLHMLMDYLVYVSFSDRIVKIDFE